MPVRKLRPMRVHRLLDSRRRQGSPRGVSDVWQAKDLRRSDFGSVAMIGLTDEFSDVWQRKDLGDRERREYPIPPLFSELRILNDLWMRTRASAHSKGVAWARIRLKHGKTRCLSRTAHSKGFSDDLTRRRQERGGFAEKSERGC